MKLNKDQRWCLCYLAENGAATEREISLAAYQAGRNDGFRVGWARSRLQSLQGKGLVYMGDKRGGWTVYRFTPAGRDWLAANP